MVFLLLPLSMEILRPVEHYLTFLVNVFLVAHVLVNRILGLYTRMAHMLVVLLLKSISSRPRYVNSISCVIYNADPTIQVTGNPLSGQVSQSGQWAVSIVFGPFDSN